MLNIARHGYSTNLIGLSSDFIASDEFNESPEALHISGSRESAPGLFELLEKQRSRADCGKVFQDYMCVVFGFEDEQRLRVDRYGRRRFRSSYLRLIQDWGLDSNNAQGAVFKGWVESRFGLFPTYHKELITSFTGRTWSTYIEEKMNSRYHNNCIYMQLDLLYEFCQWVVERFQYPASTHLKLYRGVNSLNEHSIVQGCGKHHKVIRFNNIVSFTGRRSIASEFGAYILEVDVPVVKLIFFDDLLPNHALRGEGEYLVIGGDYKVKISR